MKIAPGGFMETKVFAWTALVLVLLIAFAILLWAKRQTNAIKSKKSNSFKQGECDGAVITTSMSSSSSSCNSDSSSSGCD